MFVQASICGAYQERKENIKKRSVKVTEIDFYCSLLVLSDNSSVLVTMINGDVNWQPASWVS